LGFFAAAFEAWPQGGSFVAQAGTVSAHICAFADISRPLTRGGGGPSRRVP
jgi:hypothetical protein